MSVTARVERDDGKALTRETARQRAEQAAAAGKAVGEYEYRQARGVPYRYALWLVDDGGQAGLDPDGVVRHLPRVTHAEQTQDEENRGPAMDDPCAHSRMLACARGAPRLSVRIAVTGANSAVGQAVVRQGIASADVETVACVRSDRAASQLPPIPESRGRVARIDFEDSESLRRAFRGSTGVIHLPGILIETRSTSYESANVEPLRCAIEAAHAEDVGKFVLVGAVGADPCSANPYFRSKGLAEQLLLDSGLTYSVVRAPLVLGGAAEGARAFVRETSGGFVAVVGGGHSLEQPLDVRDLAAGALAPGPRVREPGRPSTLPVPLCRSRERPNPGGSIGLPLDEHADRELD